MGTWLPPGSCDAELKGVNDAKNALDKAWRNYQSGEHNMQAGGVATGAGAVTALGCGFFLTGVGAIVCAVGAGATIFSGLLWTESAGEGLINAKEDLEDAIDKAEAAIKAACKCIDSHMLSVPD